MTPFDIILHFLSELTAVRLRAKFEVSSFNRSRDIRGGPKIPKLGHVTGDPRRYTSSNVCLRRSDNGRTAVSGKFRNSLKLILIHESL